MACGWLEICFYGNALLKLLTTMRLCVGGEVAINFGGGSVLGDQGVDLCFSD